MSNPIGLDARRNDVWDASDEALVAGLAAADGDAAVAFVRRFQARVYGSALLILRDPGRAEDVAQEAFVRAWRHADMYDPRRATVATWLLAITRNLAIDTLRVERVRPAEPADLRELALLDAAPAPDALALQRGDVDRAAQALDALPPEQRRAVVLAGLYGRTAREIGEIERIPLGTAKTRLRAGLQKLRAVLVEEDAR